MLLDMDTFATSFPFRQDFKALTIILLLAVSKLEPLVYHVKAYHKIGQSQSRCRITK